MKQIERFVGLVTPHLSDYEPEIIQQVASFLTFFAWCHYCHGSDSQTPSLDYVTKIDYFDMGFQGDENDDVQQKKWKSVIKNYYGYSYTDALGLLLADVVKNGYVLIDELKNECEKLNEETKARKSATKYRQAWDLCYDSLDDNTEQVIEELESCFKNEINYLSTNDLIRIVWLFEQLEFTDKAKELVGFFIQDKFKSQNIQFFNPNNILGSATTIKDKFQEFYSTQIIEQLKQETIEEVFSRIHGEHNPRDKDLELFKSFDVSHILNYSKIKIIPLIQV